MSWRWKWGDWTGPVNESGSEPKMDAVDVWPPAEDTESVVKPLQHELRKILSVSNVALELLLRALEQEEGGEPWGTAYEPRC